MMFCYKCGYNLPDEAVFCNKCGARQTVGQSVAQPMRKTVDNHTPSQQGTRGRRVGKAKKKRGVRKNWIAILAVTTAVLVLAIAAVAIWMRVLPSLHDGVALFWQGATANTPDKAKEEDAFISAGGFHTLLITPDGSLWAWGWNEYGQLGDGTRENRAIPAKVMENVKTANAGIECTMAIKTDGSLWAWGNNMYGGLGDGTLEERPPIKVMEETVSVSLGAGHTMAIKTDGSLWAWGLNMHGQLGDGTLEDRATPVRVMEDVAIVSAGEQYTLAIKNDGSLWAWGDNTFGQLGDGTMEKRSTPVKVMDGVAAISAGSVHSMVIKTDGSLWAWGLNHHGQLGDGTMENRYAPIKVMDDVASVCGGGAHTMAIKPDGSLWTWGWNEDGQLGDGTREDRVIPVKVLDDVRVVSARLYHAIAIRRDGSLWAWGRNEDGQLGDGTTESRLTPVQIPYPGEQPDAPAPNVAAAPVPAAFDAEKAFAAYAQFVYSMIDKEYRHINFYPVDFDSDGEPELVCVGSYGGTGPWDRLYLADYSSGSLQGIEVNKAVEDQITVHFDLRDAPHRTAILTDGQVNGRIAIRAGGADNDYYEHPVLGKTSDFVGFDQTVWIELNRGSEGEFTARAAFTEITLEDFYEAEWAKEYYLVGDRLHPKGEYVSAKEAYLEDLMVELMIFNEQGGYWIENGIISPTADGAHYPLSDASAVCTWFAAQLSKQWK